MILGLLRRRPPPPIPAPLFEQVVAGYPFLARLGPEARQRLAGLAAEFIDRKTFSGAAGMAVDDSVRVAIAVQACLPVLHLGLSGYDDFTEIVVYPDRFLVPRTHTDEATGVVSEGLETLAGEAMDGGPVVLSWPDCTPEEAAWWNVVIHEFAHKLDLLDGEADGIPPLPRAWRTRWAAALDHAFDAFCDQLDSIERQIPRNIDPESEAADAWYGRLPLDPYAATDPAEFFAVAAEAFFLDPERLAEAFPEFHACLTAFFGPRPPAGR